MYVHEAEPTTSQKPDVGAVRLLLDVPPWRIVVSLRSLTFSSRRLDAIFRPGDDELLSLNELAQALQEGQTYHLQIDHEDEAAGQQPYMIAELMEKRLTRGGLELSFNFDLDHTQYFEDA